LVRPFSSWKPKFSPKADDVGVVVKKAAKGKIVIPEYFSTFPPVIIKKMPHIFL
jgi:hypothetical protein